MHTSKHTKYTNSHALAEAFTNRGRVGRDRAGTPLLVALRDGGFTPTVVGTLTLWTPTDGSPRLVTGDGLPGGVWDFAVCPAGCGSQTGCRCN